MMPTYQPGDLLVGWRWGRLLPGQVVVARTPRRMVVKRLLRIDHDGAWLEGDNATASTDSRTQGAYPLSTIEARIIAKLR